MDTDLSKKSGLATAGLVLGIIGAVFAFIPIINNLAFVLGVIALVFGGIALAKKASKGKALTAVVLGIASIVITIAMQQAFSRALDTVTAPTDTSSSVTSDDKADSQSAANVFDGAAVFEKISNDMTKAEVRAVTGVDPESCYESEDATFGKMENCTYGNMFKDDVTVSVTFQNGKVSNKSKFTN